MTEHVAVLNEQGDDGRNVIWSGDKARFDGVWWPRTRDASRELAVVLPAIAAHMGGQVTRVSLNIGAWSGTQPRRLIVDGALLRLGWFNSLDADTVTFGRGTHDRANVLLAPEGSTQEQAQSTLHSHNSNAQPVA